jgi:hypothetical protein
MEVDHTTVFPLVTEDKNNDNADDHQERRRRDHEEEAEDDLTTVTTYHDDDDADKSKSFSCPVYPHKTSMVTVQLVSQLDHDQNLNTAGEAAAAAAEDIKGDINNPPIPLHEEVEEEPPMPMPKLRQTTPTTSKKRAPTDQTPSASTILAPMPYHTNSNFSCKNNIMENVTATVTKSVSPPIPAPRKSVTMMMEVEAEAEAEHNSLPMDINNDLDVNGGRACSAQGMIEATAGLEKKIRFGAKAVTKKLSTFSLYDSTTTSEAVMCTEEAPLQRRNSIHNVPYVDVNDPGTRERMERYKEERRSMLRAKYKMEDYMTPTSTSEANNKYRRKSTETNNVNSDHEPVQLRKESSASKNKQLIIEDEVILKTDNDDDVEQQPQEQREVGLIDEDVNVKERAAIFGGGRKSSQSNNRSKSWTTNLVTPKNNYKNSSPRPASEATIAEINKVNSRKVSPGSPSKIRDMAAFFEQKN